MTLALATCASCGAPFTKLRQAQTTCTKACKQVLYRTEKCNAGHSATPNVSDEAGRGSWSASGGEYTRVWGPGKLSGIELRMLGLEPPGLSVAVGHPLAAPSTLYRRIEA